MKKWYRRHYAIVVATVALVAIALVSFLPYLWPSSQHRVPITPGFRLIPCTTANVWFEGSRNATGDTFLVYQKTSSSYVQIGQYYALPTLSPNGTLAYRLGQYDVHNQTLIVVETLGHSLTPIANTTVLILPQLVNASSSANSICLLRYALPALPTLHIITFHYPLPPGITLSRAPPSFSEYHHQGPGDTYGERHQSGDDSSISWAKLCPALG